MRHPYSLRQILFVTFAALCVLPVTVLAVWLYFGIQHQVMDEAHDKNQLLSQNLAMPIHTYLVGARQTLAGLGVFLGHSDSEEATITAATQQRYFRTILVLSPNGVTWRWPATAAGQSTQGDTLLAGMAAPFIGANGPGQSGVVRNPYTGEPTVLFAQPVADRLVVGLLDLQPVITLGQQVKFGAHGHAAITDQYGNVVLHPNGNWIREIHNIADWPIIRSGMQGKTGVATFFSPFVKKDMVAGYAAVPEFNWVIITPQPLEEFQSRAYALLRTAAFVVAASIVLALFLAAVISGWIARPIAAFAEMMKRMPFNGYQADFDQMALLTPREIATLQHTSTQMAREISSSLTLRDNLTHELKRQVEQATKSLKKANAKLAAQVFVDDLTKLSNRRALWKRVSGIENSAPETYLPLQVLLFDLDNFKEINDNFGHAAGDRVLSQLAALLKQETRDGDFVVRYGGDEFLIIMPHCLSSTAQQRAEAIRKAVLSNPVDVDGHSILISMSVGIAQAESKLSRPAFAELLKAADKAMYAGKQEKRERRSNGKT